MSSLGTGLTLNRLTLNKGEAMTVRPAARTDVNRSAILAQRGAYGPASRADLARVLSPSPPMTTLLTKDLLAEGLLPVYCRAEAWAAPRGVFAVAS